jgi:hypothetical protein
LQLTALCAREIVAFLKAGISLLVVPIYRCAAAEAQDVGPQSIDARAKTTTKGALY